MLHPRAGVIIQPYLPKTTARHHTTATVRKNDLTRDQVCFIPFLKHSNFSIKHRIHHHLVEPIRTESLTRAGFPLSELQGPLPIMAYKGSLRPKGVLFSGFRHIKG